MAAIWLLVKAVEHFKSLTPEGKLKKLQQTTEEMTTAAQQAADAYNNLTSEIDKLANRENALDGLKKGTIEYAAAIAKANQELIDFLTKYGLLDGATISTKDGLLVWENQEEKLAVLEKEMTDYVNTTTNQRLAAQFAENKQKLFNDA